MSSMIVWPAFLGNRRLILRPIKFLNHGAPYPKTIQPKVLSRLHAEESWCLASLMLAIPTSSPAFE